MRRVQRLAEARQRVPRLSAGVVVVRPVAGEYHYLLLRAYRNWDFPKGEVEPGEDPLAAAVREVAEETTLGDLAFRWGEAFYETAPYRGGSKVARYYLAESRTGKVCLPTAAALGRPEHHEFRWLPYTEARALLVPRLQEVLDWANRLLRQGPGHPTQH